MSFPYKLQRTISSHDYKGFLSGEARAKVETQEGESEISKTTIFSNTLRLVMLVLGVVFLCALQKHESPGISLRSYPLYSNGTHEFKRTVILVSIDALRADYLDRGLTPHLLDTGKRGLRAQFMKPVFPTLTFPNHWTLMTGLYPESHGIVANNFWDPVSETEFRFDQASSNHNPFWWWGEPVWETAEKVGVTTANYMWPGPPKTTSGVSPTYFVPWRDLVPLKQKHDQLIAWIDMPFEKRPQLLMLYDESVDHAGHSTGPMSALVSRKLHEVDLFVKDLHDSLSLRNITDIVNIIFVSDHGMADMSHPELVYMDDILGEDYNAIEHVDGWPSMGLRFDSKANKTRYMSALLDAANANPDKFEVFTHETIPPRYHFSHNERIAPVYVIPKIGYLLTNRKMEGGGMPAGNHGYDNNEPFMHAIFVAHGPVISEIQAAYTSHAHRFSRVIRESRPCHNSAMNRTAGEPHVLDGFKNVEIYNLIVTLLGISDKAASNNGTEGFWNCYLGIA